MTHTPMTFREVFEHRVATLSNGLSLLRISLVVPLWVLVAEGGRDTRTNLMALSLLVVMMVTDFLDGYLARTRGEETPLGRFLDPLADKIVVLVGLYLLVRYRDFPLWLAVFIVARDLAGIAGTCVLLFKRHLMGRPNLWGKAGIVLLGLSGLFYLMDWPGKAVTIWPVAAVFAGGIVAYWRTYGRALFGPGDLPQR